MPSKRIKNKLPLILLFLLAIISRFTFLNWGQNFFFNPDENNMATAVSQMSLSDLNPHFFAYGQFPLLLTFFTTFRHDFSTIIFTLRFWSAFFSLISLVFFYLIAKDIFKSTKIAFIFILLLIFTPGLIQSAHFGTTESLLIFVFSANIYLSLKYLQQLKIKFLLFSVLISAIGLGSKITAVFFVLPIYLSLFLVLIKSKKIFDFIFYTLIFSLILFILSIFFSPFNALQFPDFKSSMLYETSVATGKLKVFYTRQFENTIPYFFQFQKIFPYANGIFVFLFSIAGFYLFLKSCFLNHKSKLILIIIPSLIYFLYTGQLFVKWTRFMSPLFFLGPFFCLYFLKAVKQKVLLSVLVTILILPGIFFYLKYFTVDNRVTSSNWIKENISSKSNILSESGNVVNLPLDNHDLNINNFDFYQLDSNASFLDNLSQSLTTSEYIFVPSRRVFKNQNNSNYPISRQYYQSLFSGNLGFIEYKKFDDQRSLFLNSENAEETWSVFDHPTIRIYKKVNNLAPDDYQNLLTQK